MDVSPLTIGATAAITALAVTVGALIDAWLGRPRLQRVLANVLVALGSPFAGLLAFALLQAEFDPLLFLPAAALAGLAAVLVTASLATDVRPSVMVLFGILWSAIVYAPVAVALLSVTQGLLGSGLGTHDLGGALPALVAPGVGAAAVLLSGGNDGPHHVTGRNTWSVVVLFALAWPLWVSWLTGLELAVDDTTPVIILNALFAPVASAGAWLVVQRIERARTTPVAAVGGMFCGMVSITAGCGYLDGFGAAVIAAVAGTLCSLVGYFLVRRTGRATWMLVSMLVVGGGTGVALLGIFATRAGLLFTGQPELLVTQSLSVAVVVGYALVITFPLALGVRYVTSRFGDQRSARVSV